MLKNKLASPLENVPSLTALHAFYSSIVCTVLFYFFPFSVASGVCGQGQTGYKPNCKGMLVIVLRI